MNALPRIQDSGSKIILACLLIWCSIQPVQSTQVGVESSTNSLDKSSATSENWLLGAWSHDYPDCSRPAYNFNKTSFINHTDADGTPVTFKSKIVEYQIKPPSVFVRFSNQYMMESWRDANGLVQFRLLEPTKAEIVHPRPTAVNLEIGKCPIKTTRNKSKK